MNKALLVMLLLLPTPLLQAQSDPDRYEYDLTAGRRVKVCVELDARAKPFTQLSISISLPLGWEMVFAQPDEKMFEVGPAAARLSSLSVGYYDIPDIWEISIWNFFTFSPGLIGCFNLVATDTASLNELSLAADVNEVNIGMASQVIPLRVGPVGRPIPALSLYKQHMVFRLLALTPPVPGDVNDDGTVGLPDVQLALQMVVGTGNGSIEAADLNENGKVDLSDAQALLNRVIGK
jgi:hypothetical protein